MNSSYFLKFRSDSLYFQTKKEAIRSRTRQYDVVERIVRSKCRCAVELSKRTGKTLLLWLPIISKASNLRKRDGKWYRNICEKTCMLAAYKNWTWQFRSGYLETEDEEDYAPWKYRFHRGLHPRLPPESITLSIAGTADRASEKNWNIAPSTGRRNEISTLAWPQHNRRM